MATGLLLTSTGADVQIVFPLLVGLGGIALAWMNLSPRGTQLLSMLGGIALIFMGWALYVHNVSIPGWGSSPRRIVASGFVMIVGIVVAVMPWANAMLQRLTHEQAPWRVAKSASCANGCIRNVPHRIVRWEPD